MIPSPFDSNQHLHLILSDARSQAAAESCCSVLAELQNFNTKAGLWLVHLGPLESVEVCVTFAGTARGGNKASRIQGGCAAEGAAAGIADRASASKRADTEVVD